MNGVAVVVVQKEDVIITADGRDDETAGLIGADLASDGVAVGVDLVGAMVRTFLIIW